MPGAQFDNVTYPPQATRDSGGWGFVAIPAIGAPALTFPIRGVVCTTAGNMAVQLGDGSDNGATVIPVTAGPIILPYDVRRYVTNNTAVLLGVL